MWNIPPEVMCNKHLLGEHVEMHLIVGTILKGKSIKGYIEKGLVETDNIRKRHDELVHEMIFHRQMNHNSPLPEFTTEEAGNVADNWDLLASRCPRCKRLMIEKGKE
jgi:hypothetical protein